MNSKSIEVDIVAKNSSKCFHETKYERRDIRRNKRECMHKCNACYGYLKNDQAKWSKGVSLRIDPQIMLKKITLDKKCGNYC